MQSPLKSAESGRKELLDNYQPHESCPEVDGAAYMPEVYKVPMVRMSAMTDKVRVLGSKA